eukprot:14987536-Ditylum_brightwellii.AAC.1
MDLSSGSGGSSVQLLKGSGVKVQEIFYNNITKMIKIRNTHEREGIAAEKPELQMIRLLKWPDLLMKNDLQRRLEPRKKRG